MNVKEIDTFFNSVGDEYIQKSLKEYQEGIWDKKNHTYTNTEVGYSNNVFTFSVKIYPNLGSASDVYMEVSSRGFMLGDKELYNFIKNLYRKWKIETILQE